MDDFAKKSLECHNECRSLHQTPALTWSAQLASEAQEWVNNLARRNTLEHASKPERKDAGENIAMFSGRYDVAGEEATEMWYSEVEKFKFSKPSFQSGTGHFTQVVWKDSKELGMARAKTPDGKNTYVVARYSPAGNFKGKFKENVSSKPSKDAVPSFIKNKPAGEQAQGVDSCSQTKRVVVKETRSAGGVKTVTTTTTCTSSSGNKTEDEMPSPKMKSLDISDTKNAQSEEEPVSLEEVQKQVLQLHNNHRRLHQVPDLRWSKQLEQDAKAWAEKIAGADTLKHASQKERNGSGENLAYFGGSWGDIAKDATDMWYDEVKKYKFNKAGFKSGTGHFTQLVWKDSKEIGMAWAKSSDGQSVYIVARYHPAGNMMGDFEKNVFPPKK